MYNMSVLTYTHTYPGRMYGVSLLTRTIHNQITHCIHIHIYTYIYIYIYTHIHTHVQVVCMASRCSRVPFTVKLRIGQTDVKRNAHTLIPRIKEWGASAVTVHGRSRQARYSRLADWDYIRYVCCVCVCV